MAFASTDSTVLLRIPSRTSISVATKPALAIEHTDTKPSENNKRETAHVNHTHNPSRGSTRPSWHMSLIGDVSLSVFGKSCSLSVRDVHWLFRDLVTIHTSGTSTVAAATVPFSRQARLPRITVRGWTEAHLVPMTILSSRVAQSSNAVFGGGGKFKAAGMVEHGSVKIQTAPDVARQLRSKGPISRRLESRVAKCNKSAGQTLRMESLSLPRQLHDWSFKVRGSVLQLAALPSGVRHDQTMSPRICP